MPCSAAQGEVPTPCRNPASAMWLSRSVAAPCTEEKTIRSGVQVRFPSSCGALCFQIEAVLGPAEKNVKSIASQLDGLTERLSQLQHGADQNRLRATDAQQTAEQAGEQARSAQQVRGSSMAKARAVTALRRFPAVIRRQIQLCPGTFLDEARRLSCSGHGLCIVMSLLINPMHYPTTEIFQDLSQS